MMSQYQSSSSSSSSSSRELGKAGWQGFLLLSQPTEQAAVTSQVERCCVRGLVAGKVARVRIRWSVRGVERRMTMRRRRISHSPALGQSPACKLRNIANRSYASRRAVGRQQAVASQAAST
jgi:hypothetical protein